ncbi:hypothetical protein [Neisseria sp. Ec49-e6-T10]|uniref:hypothetical protein n=1 Tax=Neisseria sp. Ec49-e6-T10 TaxID=3140744 RepID=UPI003EB6F91D
MSIDTQCYPIKCAFLKGAKQGVGKFPNLNSLGIFNKNQIVKSLKRKSVGDAISLPFSANALNIHNLSSSKIVY